MTPLGCPPNEKATRRGRVAGSLDPAPVSIAEIRYDRRE